jgi:hypothetical protein
MSIEHDPLANLAHRLIQQAKFDEAVGVLNHLIAQRPGLAEAHANLGAVLLKQGKLDEARAPLEHALRLKPELSNVYNNFGVLDMEQCRFVEAIANFGRALAGQPDDPETHHNLGIALLKTGDIHAAIVHFDRTLQARPDYAEAHYNRAAARLLKGDLLAGLAEHEWRLATRNFPCLQSAQPIWDGSPLAGRNIALLAEQGAGDTLQFVRYASLVKRQAGKVFLACPRAMHPLLSRTPGLDACVNSWDSVDAEICIPLLSLPHRFGTILQSVPADVPYVFADPTLVVHWREKLKAFKRFKIGIAWQGNPNFPADRFRSISLSQFGALMRLPGVQYISLQKGTGKEQLATMAAEPLIIDFGESLDTDSGAFMDTAAIMKNLDLVITSDTATAHLAGALGVRAWVALPFLPDWRWLLKREDSPWYPTMRLFRQPRWGDWPAVFERMAVELERLVVREACVEPTA